MNKNRLPKYYCFKNNMNHPRWKQVKERFNNLYNENWAFNTVECFYGYDGNTRHNFHGTNSSETLSHFINNPIEITMDQFLEMTEPRKTWTLEEFREGKVAIEYKHTNDLDLLINICDEELLGTSYYYWKIPGENYTCNSDLNRLKLPTCLVNDIIFPSKQTNMNKKLLGYKPKPTTKFEWYKGIVNKYYDYTEDDLRKQIQRDGSWFMEETVICEAFKEAGVLDIWFDKVYEEEKKIFTLDCEGGSFELEVSKEGIYYKPDNTYLDDTYLTGVVNFSTNSVLEGSNSKKYKCSYSYVNLGCKKHIPILQLKEVVDYYDSLNK